MIFTFSVIQCKLFIHIIYLFEIYGQPELLKLYITVYISNQTKETNNVFLSMCSVRNESQNKFSSLVPGVAAT
jgi:hypothetical protein